MALALQRDAGNAAVVSLNQHQWRGEDVVQRAPTDSSSSSSSSSAHAGPAQSESAGTGTKKLLPEHFQNYAAGNRVHYQTPVPDSNVEAESGGDRDILLENQLKSDPVINILFPSPGVFLNIIGWDTMKRKTDFSVDIEVDMYLHGSDKLVVHTGFPYGMQDTTLTFAWSDSVQRYKITEVLRHRSMKNEGSNVPGHAWLEIVKQQVRGVVELAELDKGVAYVSNAIKGGGAIGYNMWPKMGFDGEVPKASGIKMASDKRGINDVGEIVGEMAGGVGWMRKWIKDHGENMPRFSDMFTVDDPDIYRQLCDLWRDHGEAVEVVFDPTKDSPSMKALKHYEKMRPGKAGAGKAEAGE